MNPAVALTKEHTDSKEICQPLTDLIIQQKPDLADTSSVVQKRRRAVQERRARLTAEAAASLTSTLPENLQRAVEIASDQGASHWISALPLTAHGFALPKGAFRDALCLRYGWQPPHLPLHCPCGKPFDADHALSCGTGGYSIMRHNEVRDLTASLLSEVCGDVQIDSPLYHCLVKLSFTDPPTSLRMQDSTSVPAVFGATDSAARCLTCASSTPTHPLQDQLL